MLRALRNYVGISELLSRSARQRHIHPYGLVGLPPLVEECPAAKPLDAVLPETLVERRTMAFLEFMYSLNVILRVEFRREPQGAAHDRTPPKTHIRRMHKANMTAHIDFDKPVTLRAVAVVHTFPLLQDGVQFVPVVASLESQGVGKRRRDTKPSPYWAPVPNWPYPEQVPGTS